MEKVPETVLLDSYCSQKPEILPAAQEAAPYSVITKRQKVFLSVFVGLLAFLSRLSANIYFPVLPQLSEYYGRSSSAINLSITL